MSVTYTIHSDVAQPQRVCTSVLDPSDQETIQRDGFVVARRRLPEPSLAELDTAVDALVAARFPSAAEKTYTTEYAGQYIRDPHTQDPRVLTMPLLDFGLADTARCLLGPRVALRNSNIRVTHPRTGDDTIWHTDYRPHTSPPPPLPAAPAVITILIYLDPADASTGPLFVVPGSHLLARQPAPTHDDLADQVAVCVQPGQVVVMNAALWHRGGPNTSNRRRRLITLQLSTVFMTRFNFEPALPSPAYQRLVDRARAGRDEPLLELLGLGGITASAGQY